MSYYVCQSYQPFNSVIINKPSVSNKREFIDKYGRRITVTTEVPCVKHVVVNQPLLVMRSDPYKHMIPVIQSNPMMIVRRPYLYIPKI